MRNRFPAVGLLFCSSLAFGQTAAAPWKFEVASVKPSAAGARAAAAPSTAIDPAIVSFHSTSLRNLLMRAYGLPRYRIQGPGWIDTGRYDVFAKLPDGAPADQVPAMLRGLLVERFQLVVRREVREENVYILSAGRNGPKLTKSRIEMETRADSAPYLPANSIDFNAGRLAIPGVTVAQFANTLAVLLGNPVLDQTGIEGVFDISLSVSASEFDAMRGSAPGAEGTHASDPGSTLAAGLKELGLDWGTRKAPIERLVVESALRTPLGNN